MAKAGIFEDFSLPVVIPKKYTAGGSPADPVNSGAGGNLPAPAAETEKETENYTTTGSFKFRGQDSCVQGLLNILVCLELSGARLASISAEDGVFIFLSSGQVSFTVRGSKKEVETFVNCYR